MRKFSVSLLVISFFMLAFCGCSTPKKEPVIYFSANAQIHTQDISMTAKVSSTYGNNVNVTLLTPKPICGVSYVLKNSTLCISYNSLKCNAPDDYLDSSNPICVILDTLCSLGKSQLYYQKTENETDIYSGKSNNGKFTLYVDSKSGYITRIKPQYLDVYIDFTDVKEQ